MSGDFGRGDNFAEKRLKVCHLQGFSALALLHESLWSRQVGQRTYFNDGRVVDYEADRVTRSRPNIESLYHELEIQLLW
jgi:hypothetical protein